MANMKKHFTYNGLDTNSIISEPLTIGFINKEGSLSSVAREQLRGEISLMRQIPNEYGAYYTNGLELTMVIAKEFGNIFTDDERSSIERWLTSPQLSTWLTFKNEYKGEEYLYCGIFTKVTWQIGNGGAVAAEIVFVNNAPYTYEKQTYTTSVPRSFVMSCYTDEKEAWVYPTITITAPIKTSITITNAKDNNKKMSVNLLANLPTVIDCQHCIVRDGTTDGVISFADLGWEDIGDLYWLRLKYGDNLIKVTGGSATITFDYLLPRKVVGIW